MIKIFRHTFGPFQENTYILADENNQAVIIDPGMYFPEENVEILGTIEKNQLQPTQLWLTHAHIDHVMGMKYIHDQFQLEPKLHKEDLVVLENAAASGARFGLKFTPYDGALHFVTEQDKLQLGEDEFSIFFVPGHSPGSIGFYNEKQKFIIGGDVLFKNSIGRTDLPGGDTDTLLNSIRTKLFVLPDDVIVYPGHGEPTTIGYEKANNPFLK
jgi:hydroxyacylglutathione hydrolase